MRAMVLHRQREPLLLEDVPVPKPKAGELLIRIEACAVCRTDLHIVDGELSEPKLPLIVGHQIAGIAVARESVDLAAFIARDLRENLRRRSEAVKADPPRIAGHPQRAEADQPSAQ